MRRLVASVRVSRGGDKGCRKQGFPAVHCMLASEQVLIVTVATAQMLTDIKTLTYVETPLNTKHRSDALAN
jgi:hypothetical protein